MKEEKTIKQQAKKIAETDGIDYIISDGPPGIGCPVISSLSGASVALLVTEPTPFGLNDLSLAINTVRELEIPCGIILNRAGIGDAGVEEYCRKKNIPVLLTIPLDTETARLYSRGVALVEGMPHWKASFIKLFDQMKEIVSERACRSER